MALDRLVAQKLAATMQLGNRAITSKIEEVSNKPRVLDGPPEKYSLNKLDTDGIEPFGVYRDYCTLYKQMYGLNPPKEGTLVVGEEKISCSYEVLIALKTLIFCGSCKSQSRAYACKIVFNLAVSSIKNGTLDKYDLCSCADNVKGYFVEEVARAVTDSVLTEREKVDWFAETYGKGEKSKEKFREFNTLDEVLDYIDEVYKQLKERKRGVKKADAVAAYIESNSNI